MPIDVNDRNRSYFLISGYYYVHDCSIRLFVNESWQPDSTGTQYPCPGPSDFEFAFSPNSYRFSIRSPFEFHHEDFSIWDSSGLCPELASISNFEIYPEFNYWVLDTTLDDPFMSCILENAKDFAFRFSFFQ